MLSVEDFTQYLRLARFRSFTSFTQLVAGFLIVSRSLTFESVLVLLQYLFILGPLLHGGLYILNNITDYPHDRLSKAKQKRPLVSGQISLKTAWVLLLLHLFAVLAALAVSGFPRLLSTLVLFFLANNLFYTFIAKRIPYLDIAICSLGHPARTAAGILLAGGLLADFIPLLTINLLGVIVLNVLKRIKEKDLDREESRPVLRYYPRKTLVSASIGLVLLSFALLPLTKGPSQLLLSVISILVSAGSLAIYFYGSRKAKAELLKVWR